MKYSSIIHVGCLSMPVFWLVSQCRLVHSLRTNVTNVSQKHVAPPSGQNDVISETLAYLPTSPQDVTGTRKCSLE
jgi:hypothetical protein